MQKLTITLNYASSVAKAMVSEFILRSRSKRNIGTAVFILIFTVVTTYVAYRPILPSEETSDGGTDYYFDVYLFTVPTDIEVHAPEPVSISLLTESAYAEMKAVPTVNQSVYIYTHSIAQVLQKKHHLFHLDLKPGTYYVVVRGENSSVPEGTVHYRVVQYVLQPLLGYIWAVAILLILLLSAFAIKAQVELKRLLNPRSPTQEEPSSASSPSDSPDPPGP